MNLVLNCEANDYVGKSMTGGTIVVRPPREARFVAHENTIIGNTVLYGATGGQLFAAGRAGERFAVRNSGALAVVEGVGAHGCEYMTGGLVAVLGETGSNFGAGMSAGLAYVLDLNGNFAANCNLQSAELVRLDDSAELEVLHTLIQLHSKKTHSERAAQLLADWEKYQRAFWRYSPLGYAAPTQDILLHVRGM
jgi:glutamate synthase domain-containing protein 3